ncbi:NAD(P)-dependent oxidoreductase [Ammoniphilus sp. YIM 78166]|uniref:NAD-dependent epimerase/dehydratase family protein n=1 Tax=Ammoniphilus sp. YIM 78166 TaxID=1644106 RepID=UPI00106F1587|nr:NAD-dependent epimerase/dehydratase family protein [Ammoniphilus sp. YIM 78166]
MTVSLVTGAAGFIGYHLAKHLSEDPTATVICVDNFIRGERDNLYEDLTGRPNVIEYSIDLTKPDQLVKLPDNIELIYHLAALNGTQNFYERPYEVMKCSTLPIFYLLDRYRDSPSLKRFIYASTSEVYASTVRKFKWVIPTTENVPLSIEDPCNPRWSYGASKLHGEVLINSAHQSFNIPYSIIRYHNIYGPRMGDKHVIPDFAIRIKKGIFELYGHSDTRSFLYIDDAVKATVLCAHLEDTKNEIINIGGSLEISILDLAKKMMEISGLSGDMKLYPSPNGSVSRRVPSVEKLEKLVGFKESVSLEEGLKRTLDYYLK